MKNNIKKLVAAGLLLGSSLAMADMQPPNGPYPNACQCVSPTTECCYQQCLPGQGCYPAPSCGTNYTCWFRF